MIVLSDDGTLDTVLTCTECGEEFRYNFSSHESDVSYDDFVAWAIQDALDEHECPPPDVEVVEGEILCDECGSVIQNHPDGAVTGELLCATCLNGE